jgi:hypothetical protein
MADDLEPFRSIIAAQHRRIIATQAELLRFEGELDERQERQNANPAIDARGRSFLNAQHAQQRDAIAIRHEINELREAVVTIAEGMVRLAEHIEALGDD